MKVEEFFAKYEEDEQMMGQIIEASKDENTLFEFLSSHGVEVVPASGGKQELSDEELSHVAGGGSDSIFPSTPGCLVACRTLTNTTLRAACKAACVFRP